MNDRSDRDMRPLQTDPVGVDGLPEEIGSLAGRLGMASAPGASGPDRVGQRWEGDLWSDLRRLGGTFEVDCLVVLVEFVELGERGIEALFGGERCGSRGASRSTRRGWA